MNLTEDDVSLKLKLVYFHEYNDLVFGITGIILNSISLVLIFKKSKEFFEMYRYILTYSTIIHLIFSFLILICGQLIEIKSKDMILLMAGPFKYTASQKMEIIAAILFIGFIYLTISALPIPFIYSILIVLPVDILGYFGFATNLLEDDSNVEFLDKRIWFNDELNKYRTFLRSKETNIYYRLLMIYVLTFISSTYIIVFYCSMTVKKIVKKANEVCIINGQHKLHKNYKQIDNILFIQALIPIIFIFIPYSFWLACIFLKASFLETLSPILWIHISWVPTIEAISTILLVKEFRIVFIKFWKEYICFGFTKRQRIRSFHNK
uniref:G_PROTEIN_RECEP_F1_2 domain-containing protein n=1 Tax=Strongyloides papillosus TaxID=174720 RepID=A0A0N5CBN4_STREA